MRETISALLLAWYDQNARTLPWRGIHDPYRTWVSETMLQQTRVETVRGYYERFLARFPDVAALAAADEADVLKLWEGLGYYSRARNLHQAARQVVCDFGGEMPREVAQLRQLKGIGAYTAGAIASIAFDQRVPAVDGNVIHVKRPSDDKLHCALHGMTRALLHNMIVGVSEGFKKELEINGVGYRASKEGKNLVMNLGYSHQVIVPEIDGITIDVPSANKVVISGPDKQKVGQFAAEVREKRPPEPYKGKGIKYVDEVIRRKVGKTGAKK